MQSRHPHPPHPRPTTRRSVALLACAALVVAACGGDDDDDVADVTTPETTMGETTEPDVTEPDMTEPTEPDVTEPTEPDMTEPTEPDMTEPTEPGDTAPPTSAMDGDGIECATSEEGGPLDPAALAELDPASALGQIDGAGTFLFVANEADLVDRLESDEELTFFVPTDEAFDMIPDDELEPLLSDPLELSSLVLDHVVIGRYTSDDLEDGTALATATEGEQWLVDVTDDGEIMVGGSAATVICPDIETANAVIHLIDRVIITPAGIG